MKYFQLGTIAFFLTTILYFVKSKNLVNDIEVLSYQNNRMDSLYQWQSQRLLNYTLIAIEQGNIINKFQSSRNEKLNNKKLQELQQKLN